jgi:hypothetical protein
MDYLKLAEGNKWQIAGAVIAGAVALYWFSAKKSATPVISTYSSYDPVLVQLGTQTALERDKMINDKEMLKLSLDAENKLLNDTYWRESIATEQQASIINLVGNIENRNALDQMNLDGNIEYRQRLTPDATEIATAATQLEMAKIESQTQLELARINASIQRGSSSGSSSGGSSGSSSDDFLGGLASGFANTFLGGLF